MNQKMWSKLVSVLLLGFVCSSSGALHPNDDEIDKSQPMPLFLGLFKKSLRREISNFTETGYQSKIYKQYVDEAKKMEAEAMLVIEKIF